MAYIVQAREFSKSHALRVAAKDIPGVTGVEDHLSFSLPI